jgi:hypothetical protein
MAYPPLIYLDTETEEKLKSYLDNELANHFAERGEHIDDLIRLQKDYWAKPTKEKATFPFTGAATIVIPLSAIAVEAIHARVMTTLFAMNQFISAKSVSPDWDPAVNPFEEHMNDELMRKMNFRRTMGDCFLEAEKFGSMIDKTGYERVVKTAIRETAGVRTEFEVVVRQGATHHPVSDARFLMPYYAQDPQLAPWCGETHTDNWYDFKLKETSGLFYEGISEDIKTWINTPNPDMDGVRKLDDAKESLEKTEPVDPKVIDWEEIWMAFNVDGNPDGRLHEIVVYYMRGARKILVYFPLEHRWRGIGICKMNEQFQKEITVQHRQRLDNATVANMRMLVINKMSNYGPREPIFPGKMWFVDDNSHISSVQTGEVYPSAYQNEQASLIYQQQRIGVNEAILGMPQVGTPGTATAELSRVQEGNKKFDFHYANFRDFASSAVIRIAQEIQQFGPRSIEYIQRMENGHLVQQFYSMPAKAIRDGILIQIGVAGQQQNRILDRQNWQQIAVVLQQYYTGLVQLAQMGGDQNVMGLIIQKGMSAITEAMRQILESYDVRNIDRIVVSELEGQLRAGIQSGNAIPGGNTGLEGNGQPPGMDIITQALSRISGNGNGGVPSLQR